MVHALLAMNGRLKGAHVEKADVLAFENATGNASHLGEAVRDLSVAFGASRAVSRKEARTDARSRRMFNLYVERPEEPVSWIAKHLRKRAGGEETASPVSALSRALAAKQLNRELKNDIDELEMTVRGRRRLVGRLLPPVRRRAISDDRPVPPRRPTPSNLRSKTRSASWHGRTRRAAP